MLYAVDYHLKVEVLELPSVQALRKERKSVNRTKTERNEKILELAKKGYRHKSIARIFHIKNVSTVSMVIWRAKQKEKVLVEQ